MHKTILRYAGFRQSRVIGERWLQESIHRNDIAQHDPILYHAYICDNTPFIGQTKLRQISEFFDTSWSKDPQLNRTREVLLRLFAIIVKAHFFLFRLDQFADEPYVFWVPDLMRTQSDRFGLYCPFLKSQKALVVAEADLALVSSGKRMLGRFPVVLTSNTDRWFDEKHWEDLAREGDLLRLLNDNTSDLKAAREYKDPQTFPYGTLFDAPESLRPQLRQAGLRWAEGVGQMYLPKGFDVDPVQAYYEHLLQRYQDAHDQLQAFLSQEDAS